jgi:hypothetical protein
MTRKFFKMGWGVGGMCKFLICYVESTGLLTPCLCWLMGLAGYISVIFG